MKLKILLSSTALFLALPLVAASYVGELQVDTAGQSINALEATIRLPRGVNIERIETGRSALLIWIKPPALDRESGTISFSGISPGGFQGKQPILVFSGDLEESDLKNFSYIDVQALKSDGTGTPVSVKLSAIRGEVKELDLDPPEPFMPIISRSEDLFEGRAFISFLAQDKGVGVARYEYASSWLGAPEEDEWAAATSPMELSRVSLFKRIYIRAVDQEGNIRTVSQAGSYRYASMLFGTIIILCVLSFLRRSFYSSPYPLS